MRIRLVMIALMCLTYGIAQAQDKKLIQFSGIVTTPDSNLFVPHVTITNKTDRNQQYIASYKGYFSFVVNPGDTLAFTAVGYKSTTVVIPNNTSNQEYVLMVKMKQMVINLPTVHVYPWANVDEFKMDLLTMNVADDDLAIAKKNLSREKLSVSYDTLPMDGQEMREYNFQNYHVEMSIASMATRYANPLLDPIAWAKFLHLLFKGDKSSNQD